MSTSPSRLLALPIEIRSIIWSYSFDKKCVHILDTGRVWCDADTFTSVQDFRNCHKHMVQADSPCVDCHRHQPVCLAAVCRQIFDEVAQLRYERTMISFASSEFAISYLTAKLLTRPVTGFSLSSLRNLQLYLGAAKYNTIHTNVHNHSLLKALAKDAVHLEILNLSFAYFYRAPQETMPLGRKTLACLLRFRGLMQLNLHIDQPPPGPIGTSELVDGALDQFWFRWRCTVAALRLHVCRPNSSTGSWLPDSSTEVDALVRRSLTAKTLTVDALRRLVISLEADRKDRRTSLHNLVKA